MPEQWSDWLVSLAIPDALNPIDAVPGRDEGGGGSGTDVEGAMILPHFSR